MCDRALRAEDEPYGAHSMFRIRTSVLPTVFFLCGECLELPPEDAILDIVRAHGIRVPMSDLPKHLRRSDQDDEDA